MILNISGFIVKDLVYKQNPDNSYIFENGKLVRENMNDIIDSIIDMLGKIYTNIITINKVKPGRIECNYYLLEQALTRYSRDIFGELRLDNKLEYLQKTGAITEEQKDSISEYSDYGFKIDSRSPYIHRQLSNLLYWLSILKPFAIYPEDNSVVKPLGIAFEFHNEYICYLLALAFLRTYGYTMTIHTNGYFFHDFLYELHFRNLSRSSLEFFLFMWIKKI